MNLFVKVGHGRFHDILPKEYSGTFPELLWGKMIYYNFFFVTDTPWAYPLCSRVLMLNPNVGEIVETSSPVNFFKIVVFPALSRPLKWKKALV